MKNFKVSKITWANYGDMELPFYRQWNKQTPLPRWFWQRIWEYPFASLHIPKNTQNLDVCGTYPFVLFKNFPNTVSLDYSDLNKLDHNLHKNKWPEGKLVVADAMAMPFTDDKFPYSFSISAVEETPDPLKVLQEMLRVTKERVVVTMDVSEMQGVSKKNLESILDFLGVSLPPEPVDILSSNSPKQKRYGQRVREQFKDIKVLGLVIDSVEPEKNSVGILIPHCESLSFLKTAISQIRQNLHPQIEQHIYILDDNSKDGSWEEIQELWATDQDITMVKIVRNNPGIPDVGQVLDRGLELVKEKFVCMVDADVFPLGSDWLSFAIFLQQKYGCSAVGCDTGLSSAYIHNLPGSWDNKSDYFKHPMYGLYKNNNFICINNFYRLSLTTTAKVVSGLVGFKRMARVFPKLVKTLLPKSLSSWVFRKGLVFPNADNGVRANYFMDINKMGPKFALPITGFSGKTPNDGVFGQNILGLVLHFALSSRVLSKSHKEIADPGSDYKKIAEQIKQQGFAKELLQNLVNESLLPGHEFGGTPEEVKKVLQDFEALFKEYKQTLYAKQS